MFLRHFDQWRIQIPALNQHIESLAAIQGRLNQIRSAQNAQGASQGFLELVEDLRAMPFERQLGEWNDEKDDWLTQVVTL